jgi:predicted Rossmann fold nucleotide-binding protein DprA/Smf involved in DNA uptake
MKEVYYLGNEDFLKLQKVAFFSSRNINPLLLLSCYDWATEQRKSGTCVISGFHSQIEKDVLHFLLKGKQPVILVLGRALYKKIPDELKVPLEEGRLLIISPVSKNCKRNSEKSTEIRNCYIAEKADKIVFGSLNLNGKLNDLYLNYKTKSTVLQSCGL